VEIEPATLAQVRAGRDGRSVLIEEDVFDVARQLKAIDHSLRLRWSESGEHFVVYQLLESEDVEKLVLTAKELSPGIVERVRQITHPSYDYVGEIDRMDKQAEKDKDDRFKEQTGEVGERLAHAVRKDLGATNKAFVKREV
jgi:hypothetical protein